MKDEMNEMIKAHYKLIAHFSDVKLWLWTVCATTVVQFIEKYIYNDWEFLKFLMVLVSLDLVTGIIKAMTEGTLVTSTGVKRTVLKGVQYGAFLIVMHVLGSFTIKGEPQSAYHYVTTGAYILLMGIEGKSILENVKEFSVKLDVGSIIDKIKDVFTKKKD
jgi:phage-related holin